MDPTLTLNSALRKVIKTEARATSNGIGNRESESGSGQAKQNRGRAKLSS